MSVSITRELTVGRCHVRLSGAFRMSMEKLLITLRMSGSRQQMIFVQVSSFKSTVHPTPKSRVPLEGGIAWRLQGLLLTPMLMTFGIPGNQDNLKQDELSHGPPLIWKRCHTVQLSRAPITPVIKYVTQMFHGNASRSQRYNIMGWSLNKDQRSSHLFTVSKRRHFKQPTSEEISLRGSWALGIMLRR